MEVPVRTSEVVCRGIVLHVGSTESYMEILTMKHLAPREFKFKKICQLLGLEYSDIRFPMD
jgi:hypothetical protein